jgi:hypothetical protein
MLLVSSGKSYQDCIHAHKNDKEYQALRESSGVLGPSIERRAARARLTAVCAVHFTDENERPITALAGIALALFTLYLWRATQGLRHYAGIQARDMRQLLAAARDNTAAATLQAEAMKQLHAAAEAQERALTRQAEAARELLDRTPQIERAYISGGGPKQVVARRIAAKIGTYGMIPETVEYAFTGNFQLQINNHGKTAGELLQYGYGFCDLKDIPPKPDYTIQNFHDWIGPGTQSRNLVPIKIPVELSEPVVYGRFYYKDIFGSCHSSGFILKITDVGTEPILAPAAYTEPD